MFDTHVKPTWCPGCGNFGILAAVKKALEELVSEGYDRRKFVSVTGIGCHAKIYDYLNVNGFYSIHGRTLPTAIGMKLANPELVPICFAGDGDALAEGMGHFIHACRYNFDITLILHNNQVFALTTGQATPTSEKGFVSKSTPDGTAEEPINPIALALVSGASFVAREYAFDIGNLKNTVKRAVKHKGFSFVEVLQPCVSFHDTAKYVSGNTYRVEPMDWNEALEKAREWNYSPCGKIPLGVFFEDERGVRETHGPMYRIERSISWRDVIERKKV